MATTPSGHPTTPLPPPPPPPPPPPQRRRQVGDGLEDFNAKRWGTIIVALVLATVAASIVGGMTNFLTGLIALGMMVFGFFAQAFRAFDPTTFAVPIFRDKMFNGALRRWQIFPFCGVLFDYRLMSAERRDLDLPVDERTPDKGTIRVETTFIWRISPSNAVRFIMNGGEETVIKMFSQRVLGRMREWIMSDREGPQTWIEALRSNGPALYVLVEKLFPGHIPRIPQTLYDRAQDLRLQRELRDIRPIGFVRYFSNKPPLPKYEIDPQTQQQKISKQATEIWKEESLWEKTLRELKAVDRPLWDAFSAAVEDQLAFIELVKTGGLDVSFPIEDLGIEISVANIARIMTIGKTGDAADRVAEAIQDALVNNIAGENLRQEIEDTLPLVGDDHKLATQLVELRRKLITLAKTDQSFGLTPEVISLMREIALELIARRAN